MVFALLLPAARAAEVVTVHEASVAVNGRTLHLTLAQFSAAQATFKVIDNAAAPDRAKYQRLPDAMRAADCLAGSNGGFFERQPFAPVGLLVADGAHSGALRTKSWINGLIVVRNGNPALERADAFVDSPAVTQALQAGPFLVRLGQPENDLDPTRMARRTFVCHDISGHWALGVSGLCTLAELAHALREPGVTDVLSVYSALNLDGGPSTGLWVRRGDQDFYAPEASIVQNYLGIVPRSGK
jgi:uncharacterized protein YigE (DUF2233 family)